MDLISKAISEICFTIPREILKLAYLGKQDWRAAPISLDEQIRFKTIVSRVLVDSNIVGGQTIDVSLAGLTPVSVDLDNYVFEVPSSRLNNRTIMTALSVNYMAYMGTASNIGANGVTNNMLGYASDVATAARRAMDSRSSIPNVATSECVVVGHNTIMVRNFVRTAAVQSLRCRVTNDERLSNISVKSALDFSRLCIFAAKSFIYNELIIKLDKGYLKGGQELSSIKSYVDGLSDAEENYQTFLEEKWGGISTINDRIVVNDLIKLQIDPGI